MLLKRKEGKDCCIYKLWLEDCFIHQPHCHKLLSLITAIIDISTSFQLFRKRPNVSLVLTLPIYCASQKHMNGNFIRQSRI